MMDIRKAKSMPIHFLDLIARDVLGESISGVSAGGGVSLIHLVDDSPINRRRCDDILSYFGALLISANKTRMTEGQAEPVISCRDDAIRDDSEMGYMVLLDGEVYAQGSDLVTSGVLTLILSAPVAGIYSVFVYRKSGNYASATLQIVVNEE